MCCVIASYINCMLKIFNFLGRNMDWNYSRIIQVTLTSCSVRDVLKQINTLA